MALYDENGSMSMMGGTFLPGGKAKTEETVFSANTGKVQDKAVQNARKSVEDLRKSVGKINKTIEDNADELGNLTGELLRGLKVDVDQNEKTAKNLTEFVKSISEYADSSETDVLQREIKELLKEINVSSGIIKRQVRQEAIDTAASKRVSKKEEKTFIDENPEMTSAMGVDVKSAIEDLTKYLKASENLASSIPEGKEGRTVAEDLQIDKLGVILDGLNEKIEAAEDRYKQMEDFLSDEDKKAYKKKIDSMKKEAAYTKNWYNTQLKDTKTNLGKITSMVVKSFGGIKLDFGNISDIANMLNLNTIRESLVSGAESAIDIMSETSQVRGSKYSGVKSIRSGVDVADTYGGRQDAGDIMKVYQMVSVGAGYLKDTAGYISLFEKETGVTNSQVEGILNWAESTGMSKRNMKSILDNLQSVREFGGDVSTITSMLSENMATVS